MTAPTASRPLWSFEFVAMCLVITAAFGNVSVFYSFYHYLGAIGIPLEWRGFLVGLEPMAAFFLRLIVLPWLHVRNAFAVVMVSLFMLIAASWSYQTATTIPSLIVLRIFHGAVFVLLTSAAIALVVSFIPAERSGQGFSVLSIATMIPYAIIPPLSEAVLPYLHSEAEVYAAVSVFSVLAIFLLAAVRRRVGTTLGGLDGELLRRPSMWEIRENLGQQPVLVLLVTILLTYLAHATVFYFLKDLSLQLHTGEVGIFFGVSMAAMIAVRALAASRFDRVSKLPILRRAMGVLILFLSLLPLNPLPALYYLLAAGYGLCMGVILPLLNALLFTVSPPPLRGLNTNMTVFTMDVAYFLVPYLGGTIIAFGGPFSFLFYLAAGFLILAVTLISTLAPGNGKA